MTDSLQQLPGKRREAQRLGLKHYFTGKPCKKGHLHKRAVSNGRCLQCHIELMLAFRVAKPENIRATKRRYRAANVEKIKAYNTDYHAEHREENVKRCAVYYAANTARERARKRELQMIKSGAMPPWADRAAIEAVYEEAARLERQTGISHDVDHIVPVIADNVCGLHVHWNLQPLPRADNRRKHNKFDENGLSATV